MLIQNSNIAWFIIRTANKTRGKYVIYHCKLNKGSLYTRLLVNKLKKNVSNQTFYHGKNSISTIKTWKPLLPINTTVAVIQTSFF